MELEQEWTMREDGRKDGYWRRKVLREGQEEGKTGISKDGAVGGKQEPRERGRNHGRPLLKRQHSGGIWW